MAKDDRSRKLTPAEARRNALFLEKKAALEAQGYTCEDLTVGIVYANVMALVLGLPFLLLFGILFFLRHGLLFSFSPFSPFVFLLAFCLLAAVHELIHGLCWGLLAKGGFRAISFGFIPQYLTPYCACSEPLPRWAYIVGALAPTVLLGILPCILALLNGSLPLLLMGLLLTFAGGGDMLIVLKLLGFKGARDAIFLDHPYACGLVAFTKG